MRRRQPVNLLSDRHAWALGYATGEPAYLQQDLQRIAAHRQVTGAKSIHGFLSTDAVVAIWLMRVLSC
jgi:hypothetical protein